MNNFNKKAVFAALMGALSSISSFAWRPITLPKDVEDMSMDDLIEFDWPDKPNKNHKHRDLPGYYLLIKRLTEGALQEILKNPNYKAIIALNKKLGHGKLLIFQRPWLDGCGAARPAHDPLGLTTKYDIDDLKNMYVTRHADEPDPDTGTFPHRNRIKVGTLKLRYELRKFIREAVPPVKELGVPQARANHASRTFLDSAASLTAFTRKHESKHVWIKTVIETILKHELGHVCDQLLSENLPHPIPTCKPHMQSLPKKIPCSPYSVKPLSQIGLLPYRDHPVFLNTKGIITALANNYTGGVAEAKTSELFAELLTIALDQDPSYITCHDTNETQYLKDLQVWGHKVMKMVKELL